MRLKSLLAAAGFGLMTAFSALAAQPAAAAESEKIAIMLDWFVNPDHAALVIAKEKGFFAAQGLDVELQAPADPNDPPKMLAAGKVEMAVSYQPQLHLQAAEGLPVVRVGTLISTPLNSVVALKGGPISSLKDLKGRKVGYSVGGFEDAVLGAMLESAGLKLSDVDLVNINFSLSPAIYAGQVDAVIGAFRNFELNQMDLAGKPGIAFYPEENGVPPYDELILLAHKDHLKDAALKKVLTAIEQASLYILNHPADAWETFIKAYPDLNDDLNKRAWADTLPRLALRPAALDQGRYERFAEFLKQRGLIKETIPVARYAVALR